jgi:hypothetical protein
MDPWDWYAVMRARSDDPIREWAELESKSATTSEDLYQSQAPSRPRRGNVLALLAISAKLVAALVQTWLTRSR